MLASNCNVEDPFDELQSYLDSNILEEAKYDEQLKQSNEKVNKTLSKIAEEDEECENS